MKILEKVRKILALAGNNSSEEEAHAAMLKAQALMAEHGLTMADVEDSVPATKEVVDTPATDYTRTPWWHKALANMISGNFRCEVYGTRFMGKSRIRFIGLKEDVELACQVYGYAVDTACYHADKYSKKHKSTGIKNDYLRGFIRGLNAKFDEQVERNNWGLILVKDDAVVEAVSKIRLRKTTPSRVSSAGSGAAFDAGYQQGKSFERRAGVIEG